MAKYGKRTTAARAAFAGKSMVTVEEAVALIKSVAAAKFDESLEIAMNLGVDPRHADQMVRGTVNLPNGTGKSVRVAVLENVLLLQWKPLGHSGEANWCFQGGNGIVL